MGMTNRQFQGLIRALLAIAENALTINPDNDQLQKLVKILQEMIEDGTD